MSDTFDELARAAARPVTRSRALKILGGALLAATVARPSRAGATTSTCVDNCVAPDKLCSVPKGVGCIKVCCPQSQPVCCTSADEVRCCYPGQQCEQYTSGGSQRVRCKGCPTGQPKCGSICCGEGETCADPDLEYCCPPRYRACRGGGTVSCCKPSEACCAGKCCPPGERCYKGKCRDCPDGTKRCGDRRCCEKGETCCNGKCCGKSQKCCGDDHCCKKKKTCCGLGCCGENEKCCGGDYASKYCCPKNAKCCGDRKCCGGDNECASSATTGDKVCCPPSRIVRTGSGRKVCCPSGSVATGNRCCPSTIPNCVECDPPCPPGEFCNNGLCFPL